MRVRDCVGCEKFPCGDVRHECYLVPDVEVNPDQVSLMMISEAAPADSADYYYATGNPLFQQTTLQAFQDAGAEVSSFQEVLDLGVYLTTAVKCGKTGYGLKASTIKECSHILEQELTLFPQVKVYLLMGSVAIQALNYIARRRSEPRVIPPGSTYKIRHQAYHYDGKRVFPSYLQAGPSFFIEKSKRRMIAEDIAHALTLIR
jgi:uracil-DNA glycosylase